MITNYTDTWRHLWIPPERQTLSTWAQQNFFLSPEYSPRTGLVRLYGWQKGIFDAFTDPRVEEIALMTGTQLIKTLFIQSAIAYVIANDPGPILLLEPKEGFAKEFSKQRLGPMIRDCPLLRSRVSEGGAGKDGGNTILSKDFPGGNLTLVSALSATNLAGRTVRYLFCDETDKFDGDVDGEGDPIRLARYRTVNFGTQRKIILACSPTTEHGSRIARAYADSDQRQAFVPCHKCGEYQVLKWENVIFLPTAHYQCSHCGAGWNDVQRWSACEKVEWRAQQPFRGKAGFHISHLYSPFTKLSTLVDDFHVAKKNGRMEFQTFINCSLAETWVERGTTPNEEILFARREDYPFGEEAVVPKRALFLTAAVDVQESPPRLECEIVAWGRDRESWSIGYEVIQAFANDEKRTPLPVTSDEVWAELDRRVLQRNYIHESGSTLPIWCMCIDTGSRAAPVYQFALKHIQPAFNAAGGLTIHSPRTVVCIKGASNDDGLKIITQVSKENAARNRQGVRIVHIGTRRVKTELFDNLLHVKPDPDGTPTPNALHFPMYERPYFDGLCSEHAVRKANGEIVFEKKPSAARNEPLDLKVYSRAAATMCGIDRFQETHWRTLESNLKITTTVVPSVAPTSSTKAPVAPSIPAYQLPRPVRRVVGRFI